MTETEAEELAELIDELNTVSAYAKKRGAAWVIVTREDGQPPVTYEDHAIAVDTFRDDLWGDDNDT